MSLSKKMRENCKNGVFLWWNEISSSPDLTCFTKTLGSRPFVLHLLSCVYLFAIILVFMPVAPTDEDNICNILNWTTETITCSHFWHTSVLFATTEHFSLKCEPLQRCRQPKRKVKNTKKSRRAGEGGWGHWQTWFCCTRSCRDKIRREQCFICSEFCI